MKVVLSKAKHAIDAATTQTEAAYEKAKADTTKAADEAVTKIESAVKSTTESASKSVEAAKVDGVKAYNKAKKTADDSYKETLSSLQDVYVKDMEEGKSRTVTLIVEAKRICIDGIKSAGLSANEGLEQAKHFQKKVFTGITTAIDKVVSLAQTTLGAKP